MLTLMCQYTSYQLYDGQITSSPNTFLTISVTCGGEKGAMVGSVCQ